MQKSKVIVVALAEKFVGRGREPVQMKRSYYGKIEDIWKLDYVTFSVPLFRCKWDDLEKGVRFVDMEFIFADFNIPHVHDPFILPSQAKQDLYIDDPTFKRWSTIRYGNRNILGVEGVVDEEEYDQFDELLLISTNWKEQQVIYDENYARIDHNEGLWVRYYGLML